MIHIIGEVNEKGQVTISECHNLANSCFITFDAQQMCEVSCIKIQHNPITTNIQTQPMTSSTSNIYLVKINNNVVHLAIENIPGMLVGTCCFENHI